MRLQQSALLLPLLASTSLALPHTRRTHKIAFKRIYRERAEVTASASASASVAEITNAPSSSTSSDFAGIPVATSTAALADYLPASSASDRNITGIESVPPSVNVSSDSISQLLAETTAFSTYSYTGYVPTSTSSASASAVSAWSDTGSSVYSSSDGSSDSLSDDGSSDSSSSADQGSSSDALQQAIQAAESYANNQIGSFLPTLTLEIILQPSQVRLQSRSDMSC